MHDNSNESYLLLLDSLCYQVVLEELGVVDIRANVTNFSLLALQSLLALAGTCRQ